MLFEARFRSGMLFKQVVEAIADGRDVCNLHCCSAGMTIQAIDICDVALSEVWIDATAMELEHYSCKQVCIFGVNMSHVRKVLKWCSKSDSLTLRWVDYACDVIELSFSSSTGVRESTVCLHLVDLYEAPKQFPTSASDVQIDIPSEAFARACSELRAVGPYACISACSEKVTFTAQGGAARGSVALRCGLATASTRVRMHGKKKRVHQLFSLDHLQCFARATPLASRVSISMTCDEALLVEYRVRHKSGRIRYLLAPRTAIAV